MIEPIAENGIDQKSCFYQHIKERRGLTDNECGFSRDNEHRREQKTFVHSMLTRVAEQYPQVILIDPKDVQCNPEHGCLTHVEGVPIYDDSHHINEFGSRWLGRQYLEQFGNPLVVNDQAKKVSSNP